MHGVVYFYPFVKDVADELGGVLTFILVPPLLHGNFDENYLNFSVCDIKN